MEKTNEWSVWKDKMFIVLVATLLAVLSGALWAVWAGTEEAKRVIAMVEKGTAIVAAAGVILTVYVMVGQTRASLRATSQWREQDKSAAIMNETFRLIEKWDDPHFLSARAFVRKLGRERADISDNAVVKQIKENPRLESSVNLMLNYFDFVRLSMKEDRVDHAIIKLQMGQMAMKHIERIEAWVKTKDSAYMDDLNEFKKMMM